MDEKVRNLVNEKDSQIDRLEEEVKDLRAIVEVGVMN